MIFLNFKTNKQCFCWVRREQSGEGEYLGALAWVLRETVEFKTYKKSQNWKQQTAFSGLFCETFLVKCYQVQV